MGARGFAFGCPILNLGFMISDVGYAFLVILAYLLRFKLYVKCVT